MLSLAKGWLVLTSTAVFANFQIDQDQAEGFLKSRIKRWIRSNMERECFTSRKICRNFEEFAEGAENVYGEQFIHEDRRTKSAHKNFYVNCHLDNPNCRRNGENCECNKMFKNWLRNPSFIWALLIQMHVARAFFSHTL